MTFQSAAVARKMYEALGYDTLPLLVNSKRPSVSRWQTRAPLEMWQGAPDDANIGLRCGGRLRFAVIDADDKNAFGTSARVFRFLAQLGLHEGDYPLIATPSEGRHFYIALAESLQGNLCLLAKEIGAGEFRFGPSAQVAAPPSIVDGRSYRLLLGDFGNLPVIKITDLQPILRTSNLAHRDRPPSEGDQRTAHSITRAQPTISRKAQALLEGKGLGRYAKPSGVIDRSAAEQGLITSLIDRGHDFDSVFALFLANHCAGRFREECVKNPAKAEEWLRRSYQNALLWAETHESRGRSLAREALEWAERHLWTGRTADYDREVFIAHARIAFDCGRVVYAASCRDVAQKAGVNHLTAARATNRLRHMGFIALKQESSSLFAAKYRIAELNTLPHTPFVRECIKLVDNAHDVFRYQGFGKAGARIWACLLAHDEPLTETQIAALTNRSVESLRKKIIVMEQYGMASQASSATGEITWRAEFNVNLDAVARQLGVSGLGDKQRQIYRKQRELHRLRIMSDHRGTR